MNAPALEEWGHGGNNALLMLFTDINFFTLSSYIPSSHRLYLFIFSGIHDLPQNSTIVCERILVKSNLSV